MHTTIWRIVWVYFFTRYIFVLRIVNICLVTLQGIKGRNVEEFFVSALGGCIRFAPYSAGAG